MASDSFGADRTERFLAVEVENDDRTKEISGWYTIEVCSMWYFHRFFTGQLKRRGGRPSISRHAETRFVIYR